MKSLSAYSIVKVLHNQDAGRILIGMEMFNATSINRRSNHYSQILGERLGIAMLGNSDAHTLNAIGLGMTEFLGYTAQELIQAIQARETVIRQKKAWNTALILGSWAADYIASTFIRLGHTA